MGLSNPGTFKPPSESEVNRMDAARAALQREGLDSATSVTLTTSWSGFFGDFNTGQEAALNRVALLQGLINKLGNEDWFSVMSGQASSEWWFSRATLYHAQLCDVNSTLGEWSFEGLGSAYVSDTANKTVATISDGLEKAKDIAKFGVPTLVLVAGLVAVAYLVFSFRRA